MAAGGGKRCGAVGGVRSPATCRRLIALAAAAMAGTALGQLPSARLDAVFPAGAAPGTTVELTIHGENLDDIEQLVFSHPGITAVPRQAEPGPLDRGPRTVPDTYTVTLAAGVPAGHHAVRCRGRYGLSNARPFVVDPLPHVPEEEPNDTPAQATAVPLPGVVAGRFTGGPDSDRFRITGRRGQRLAIEALARRIDSRAAIVLRLEGPDGRLIAEARPAGSIEPALEVEFAADGDHLLTVTDAVHGNGVDHGYLIRLSAAARLAYVFPPAVAAGATVDAVAYGWNLPGGSTADVAIDGRRLERVPVRLSMPADIEGRLVFSERLEPAQFAVDGVEFRLPSPGGPSNPVLVAAAGGPVVQEAAANDTPETAQPLTLPAEVVGRFFPRRDVDWYRFDAKAGEVLWIEVWSHRLGLPTDPALLVQQVTRDDDGTEKVKTLVTVDEESARLGGREFDQRSFDPAVTFTAPADGTYRLLIRDGYSMQHDDPRLVYRMVVRPPRPDFRLVAVPVDTGGAVLLRKGGRAAVRVVAARLDGFDGEIAVEAEGLPAGVTAEKIVIGPAVSAADIILTADKAAAGGGEWSLVGRATTPRGQLVRRARFGLPLDPLPFVQPNQQAAGGHARLADTLPVTVSADENAPVVVTLGGPPIVETSRGGIVKIPYTVARGDGAGAALTGFPAGLPPNVNLQQVGIGGGNGGEIEIKLPANASTGSYSFRLAVAQQGLSYARNPSRAVRAKEQADGFAAVLAEVQAKADTARKAAQGAAATLATANAGKDEGAKGAAREAKTAADAADQEAQKLLQAAQAEKQRLTQAAEQARQQSAAKPVNVVHPTNTITLSIAEHPVRIGGLPPLVMATQGMPLAIPFTVERLYGFAGDVTVQAASPPGTTGIPGGTGRAAAGQNAGALELRLAANASPGEHEIPLTFSMNFNGQPLTHSVLVKAVVAASPSAPQ